MSEPSKAMRSQHAGSIDRDGLVRALGLVNRELERDSSPVLVQVGRKLLAHPGVLGLLGFVPWHRELRRFRDLASRVSSPFDWISIDHVERLAALALQGRSPDAVELCAVPFAKE